MDPLVSTIEIDRPPAEVYAYVTDPTRFAEWQREVVRVRTPGPLSPGAQFSTIRRVAGAERASTQEITDDQPPKYWAVRGIDGPVRAHASIAIESLDDGARSLVTFSLGFEGHGVGVALLPLVRRQAGKGAPLSYQRLKRLLESDD